MPFGLLTSTLNSALSGLVGAFTPQGSTQNNSPKPSQATQGRTPITDTSQDRIDLNDPAKTASAAPPVAAYQPPAPAALVPTMAAGTEPGAETAGTAPQNTAEDAPATGAGAADRPAAAPSGRSVTGSLAAENLAAETVSAKDSSQTSSAPDAWSDEEQARAMAIKALQQERMINITSSLTEAAEKHAALQADKRAEKVATTAETSTGPALLVA